VSPASVRPLATIGYEGTTVDAFLATLRAAGVELLVDVRAVASSRRPGFAKSRLAANVDTIGVGYLHLRDLGTPADGRAAARAGHHDELRRIFLAHMETDRAQEALAQLADVVRARHVALLCFEADPAHCHRRMVAEALQALVPIAVTDLMPQRAPAD
jgi:uncharacterized protein (DUF488 family)